MSEDAIDIARDRPRFAVDEARRLLRDRFGVDGELSPLPSDRDLNFDVRSTSGERYVLKFAQARESRDVVLAQHAAMRHLLDAGLAVPEACTARDGHDVLEMEAPDGRAHLVRLLTYVPGVPLGTVQPRSLELVGDVGRFMGRVTSALVSFGHPALERELIWDVARAERTIEERLSALDDDERPLVEYVLGMVREVVASRGTRLRQSVVHNDANDYNLLVNGPGEHPRCVSGLIDFGDMLRSYTVAEPAIAAAYALLGTDEPLRAASVLIASFHQSYPLTEDELSVLFPMTCARLAMSVCISADQRRMEPENEYLLISRQPALAALRRLRDVHPRFAECVFRRDAGLEPCSSGGLVAAWCASHAGSFEDVMPSRSGGPVVLDFSTTSSDFSAHELFEPAAAADRLDELLDGDRIGVGRYGEVRLVYRGDQFRTGSESRTVHLGLDLFAPSGTPLHAPLAGTVHRLADHAKPYDYGPTVVLAHRCDGGLPFYTLYGHLARASLDALSIGQTIDAGEPFAALGTADENGGWAPHVHVQLVADMMDFGADVPGVAAPWLMDVWRTISPDPSTLLSMPSEAAVPIPLTGRDLVDSRRRHLGPALSLSYADPLTIHRGYLTHLYDANGQEYLDSVNNVAHVGHSHPRVVDALARQARVLNTNTRYLYEQLTQYAEELTSTLPEPLRVCFFVNSGSEANDLALRMARAATASRGVAVLDQAYHGNLSSLIEISPYKFDGPGGAGRPDHVHVLPMPDPYRDGRSASDHVAELRRILVENSVGAFIAESIMSCGGQIVYPDGYLKEAFEAVREHGGVCISDEVQTGFGRVGDAFWAFERQGARPDIVTMGKPIGNGHPLGAVVTTSAIAEAFRTGMEYFNTFGGNPVSCAVGLAVLDVIREEQLQEKALRVGAEFQRTLRALQNRHEIIGDVRGAGLFLGVELVRSRATKEPAAAVARYVVECMRQKGILASIDGPLHNVLKIKPPLSFTALDADRYVGVLEGVLGEDYARAHGP